MTTDCTRRRRRELMRSSKRKPYLISPGLTSFILVVVLLVTAPICAFQSSSRSSHQLNSIVQMSLPHQKRVTTHFDLPQFGIGTRQRVLFHEYLPEGVKPFNPDGELTLDDFKVERAYVQASLHCDELPGMLVSHHLLKLLDQAAARNGILKPITIVPYANPIGLQQIVMGSHLGRFSLSTGVNFNRDWIDVTAKAGDRAQSMLSKDDRLHNTAVIRQALFEETRAQTPNLVEKVLKQVLFQRAAISQIVLDLHCDSDAIMHMYTHDRLWPQMQDLSRHIRSKCNLIAPESGGNPFDEACSCPWATLMDRFVEYPVEMACQSVTIELRGEAEVYDSLAHRDALALYDFFAARGYVLPREDSQVATNAEAETEEDYDSEACPLTGVDMIHAPVAGLLAWKVRAGDKVEVGQLLGEIVNVEDVDAPRTPIVARTAGIVYGLRRHKLSWPGETVIKVAGKHPLEWRQGNLLTAR